MKTMLLADSRCDFLRERMGVPGAGFENDVPALDISANVLEIQCFEIAFQHCHREDVVAADVDPAKECDPGFHPGASSPLSSGRVKADFFESARSPAVWVCLEVALRLPARVPWQVTARGQRKKYVSTCD